MHEKERELVGLLAKQCKDIGDVQSLLKNLFKGTIEEMLEAEMDDHLRYEKHSLNGDGSGNSRNGYNKKTLKTELGETEIRIPRDRNGKCNPHLIPKYQTKTDDLENRIIAIEAVKKSVYLAI
ncbi:MAG: transposase [Firmicutes bacterium]|nr:transposase [Bacillota bacterium]